MAQDAGDFVESPGMARAWRLLYDPRVHGVSIGTFFRQCQAEHNCHVSIAFGRCATEASVVLEGLAGRDPDLC